MSLPLNRIRQWPVVFGAVAPLLAAPSAWPADWADLPLSDALPVSIMPALQTAGRVTARQTNENPSAIVQLVDWHGGTGRAVDAQLLMVQLRPFAQKIFLDSNQPTLRDEVARMFPEFTPVITAVGDVRNVVGSGRFARFTMAGRECVMFRVFDGIDPGGILSGNASGNKLGKTRLDGWYCAESLGDDEAHVFIQSAGIRGFAEPTRDRTLASAAPRPASPADASRAAGGGLCGQDSRSVGLLSMAVAGAYGVDSNPTRNLLPNLRSALTDVFRCSLDYDFGVSANHVAVEFTDSGLWTGTVVEKQPDRDQVLAVLRRAGLDFGVMVFVQVKGSNYSYYNGRTIVFLIDAERGTVHQGINLTQDFDASSAALKQAVASRE